MLLALVGACIDGERVPPPHIAGADADRGKELVWMYACGGCHIIPGVDAANGTAGPPLTDWAERTYIAGAMYNTPDNLIAWLLEPDAVEPGTAMPDLGILPDEARDMAAYLFTLGNPCPLGPPHPFPAEWIHSVIPRSSAEHGYGKYRYPACEPIPADSLLRP